jgi:hypothetical protein
MEELDLELAVFDPARLADQLVGPATKDGGGAARASGPAHVSDTLAPAGANYALWGQIAVQLAQEHPRRLHPAAPPALLKREGDGSQRHPG